MLSILIMPVPSFGVFMTFWRDFPTNIFALMSAHTVNAAGYCVKKYSSIFSKHW